MEDSSLVLIVDDDPETARMLGQALSPQWRIETQAPRKPPRFSALGHPVA
jgi:hypothetical protein